MKPPFFLSDDADLYLFWDIRDIEDHLEPPSIGDSHLLMTDAEGRELHFKVGRKWTLFWPVQVVVFDRIENGPNQVDRLRSVLLENLNEFGSTKKNVLKVAPLEQLVREIIRTLPAAKVTGAPLPGEEPNGVNPA